MSTPAVVTDPQPGLSEGARLVNTFFAPSTTFTDIRRNASWWAPWLLLSLVSIAFLQTVGLKIGWEQVTRNELRISGRAEKFEQAPPEQQQRGMQMSQTIYKVTSFAPPLSLLLFGVILGGILMAVFNFGMGAEISFKQSLAIVFYAFIPSILGSLLGIVSLLIGVDPEGFNMRNPVATNPAYFMDPTKAKFLYGMASAADVIVIWTIILLGIGYSSVSKVKKGTAIATIAALFIVFKLIVSGISAM
jgi:Yip1 domain